MPYGLEQLFTREGAYILYTTYNIGDPGEYHLHEMPDQPMLVGGLVYRVTIKNAYDDWEIRIQLETTPTRFNILRDIISITETGTHEWRLFPGAPVHDNGLIHHRPLPLLMMTKDADFWLSLNHSYPDDFYIDAFSVLLLYGLPTVGAAGIGRSTFKDAAGYIVP